MSEGHHDPLASLGGRHGGGHEEGEGNWLVSYADMMTLLVGFFVILLSFSTVDEEKLDAAKKSITKEFGGQYEVPYDALGKRIQEEVNKSGFSSQVVVKVLPDGVEISFLGTVFFALGSVDLKDEARKMLESIFPIIKKENSEFDVTIEGHTDDNPIAAGFHYRDNFELSSIRACRVLDIFFKSGFAKERVVAVGYGESRPIVKNRDDQGNPIAANQAQNRRVVIKVKAKKEGILEKSGASKDISKEVNAHAS